MSSAPAARGCWLISSPPLMLRPERTGTPRPQHCKARLKKITTGQDSCILELEQLPADPADTAAAALRTRIRAPFAELHAEREQLQARLDALAAVVPQAADTSLLDDLPLAGDILPALPPDLKARLFAAFDLHILWNKAAGQATIWAEITDATLKGLPGILNPGQDGYDDTSEHASDQPELMEDLFEPAMTVTMSHRGG